MGNTIKYVDANTILDDYKHFSTTAVRTEEQNVPQVLKKPHETQGVPQELRQALNGLPAEEVPKKYDRQIA